MLLPYVGAAFFIGLVVLAMWSANAQRLRVLAAFEEAITKNEFTVRKRTWVERPNAQRDIIKVEGMALSKWFRFQAVRTNDGLTDIFLEIEDADVNRTGYRGYGFDYPFEFADKERVKAMFEKAHRRSYL